jgi:hypothetical protein
MGYTYDRHLRERLLRDLDGSDAPDAPTTDVQVRDVTDR